MQEEIVQQYLKTMCAGRKHASSSDRIEQELKISGNELRKNVNRLRRKGIPIASGDAGYFYAENAGEIYSTIRQLQKMRSGLDAAIRGLESSLERFGEPDGDAP